MKEVFGGKVPHAFKETERSTFVACFFNVCVCVCFYVLLGKNMVLGQNGSGQNGTDKMVWTKWYTDKMVLDKMAWTKWYGQNGTDKILRIKSSSIQLSF